MKVSRGASWSRAGRRPAATMMDNSAGRGYQRLRAGSAAAALARCSPNPSDLSDLSEARRAACLGQCF
jgi:hypothetical protein